VNRIERPVDDGRRVAWAGRQPAADTNINPLDAIHVEVARTHPYDPERARALLAEAGWTPGPDGIRRNAAGDRLTLTLMTTAGNQSRELVQQVIQAQLRDVGIDIRLRNEPPRVLFGETVRKRAFEDMVMFAWISAPESVPRTILHSDQIPTQENNWNGQNVAGYANPEMDALLDRIERELDPAARATLWATYQNLYAETLPALPLYFRANPHILPPWLDGYEPTGHLAPSTLWVEEWVDSR
jgi:peptide/nickel transport system substrate-binding protein